MVIIAGKCWPLQNKMAILRSVLEVKFTKYCTCAAGNPGQSPELSQPWTGFSIIVELEPYMLGAYLGNLYKLIFKFLVPFVSKSLIVYHFPFLSTLVAAKCWLRTVTWTILHLRSRRRRFWWFLRPWLRSNHVAQKGLMDSLGRCTRDSPANQDKKIPRPAIYKKTKEKCNDLIHSLLNWLARFPGRSWQSASKHQRRATRAPFLIAHGSVFVTVLPRGSPDIQPWRLLLM